MTLVWIGRVIFGAYFLYSGLMHFKNAKGLHGYAKAKGVPTPELSVFVTGVLLSVGGLGILLNMYVPIACALLLVFMVPTTFIMHAFWKGNDPMAKMNEQIAFSKNLALIGALLMILK